MSMPKTIVVDDTPLNPRDVPPARPSEPVNTYVADYAIGMEMAHLRGGLGTKEQIEGELDEIARAMRGFFLRPPDAVLRECSAYSARLTELAVLLHRVENMDRTLLRVRTMQVTRFIEELDRQFKIASRLIEVQRQDLALMGGAGA